MSTSRFLRYGGPTALFLVLVIASHAEAQGGVVAVKDSPEGHRDAYYRERAYPLDSIPRGAHQRAVQSVFGLRSTPAMVLGAISGGWRAVGPTPIAPQATFYNGRGPTGGRVNSIAVDPRNSSVVYVGTARGGVWKTTDGGSNWRPMTDAECALAINVVVLDRINPDIVYAATGDHGNGFSSGCGVLRSSDGGASWTTLGSTTFAGMSILDLLLAPTSAGATATAVLFATTDAGSMYRSDDGGNNWVAVPTPANFEQLIVSPGNSNTLYAGTASYSPAPGVYQSVDGGLNWTRLANGIPSFVGRTRVAISPSFPNTVYAASCDPANDNRLLAVYRSTDFGASWSTVNSSLGSVFNRQCWYDFHLEVHPLYPGVVYVGGVWLYRSTDSGLTFQPIGEQQIHADQHGLGFDPQAASVVYAGNDGGVYRSLDDGDSWVSLGSTISTALFTRGIAVNPANPGFLLGGTQDNGSIEANGTSIWNEVSSGDGGYGAYDVATGGTAWTEYVWGYPTFSGPKRRDPGGSFTFRRSGIDLSDRGSFYPPLVMDPVRPLSLYFGTYRIYRTRNNGANWSPISLDMSRASGTVTAIAPAGADSNVVYAGYSDGVIWATADGGTNWTSGAGVPNRDVTAITVDPASAVVAYATVSGFNSAHVLKTTNRGVSWSSISGNLPNAPANDLLVLPTAEIIVATDVGLFRSANGGTTWTLFGGLPNVVMMSLAYHAASSTLFVGSYGRGMFAYSYSATTALRGDVDRDGTVSAADALAVLKAVVGLANPTTYRAWPNGDANCDGVTSVLDAQIILRFVVALGTGTSCVGTIR